MMDTGEETPQQDYRRTARGLGLLAWAFVFFVYIGAAVPMAGVRLLVPPPTVGWALFLGALWLLPRTPRTRASLTWALVALLVSVPAGVVIIGLNESQAWYRIARTAALLAHYLIGAGAVFCLMGFLRELAQEAGSHRLARGAALRSWLFVVNAMMPLVQLLAGRAQAPAISFALAVVPPVLSVICMTGIVSYTAALVRLCNRPRRATPPTEQQDRQAVRDLMTGEASPPADSPAAAREEPGE